MIRKLIFWIVIIGIAYYGYQYFKRTPIGSQVHSTVSSVANKVSK